MRKGHSLQDHARDIPRAPARGWQIANLSIFLAGIAVIAVALNYFSMRSEYRSQIDATKTRAYSLSQQTRQLLASLEGEWELALIMSPKSIDRAVRRQVDEVITRFTDSSSKITVVRIDPAVPESVRAYQTVVNDLRRVYKGPVAEYETALDEGVNAFSMCVEFAKQQAPVLQQLLGFVGQEDPTRAGLEDRAKLLTIMAEQGPRVLNEVQKARETTDGKPIPDFETARSILAEALSQSASQLDELAMIFSRWRERANSPDSVKRFAASANESYGKMARQLAEAADPIKRLEPLELNSIGQQLQEGEAIAIIGPHRAAVIPSWQLFPKNFQSEKDGMVTFDQRFRGEQIIASTLRSLTVDRMPRVVFVHAETKSLLRAADRGADLVGVASMLRASRYDVGEWNVGQQPERPVAEQNQRTVWIVVPPAQRKSLQMEQPEQSLLKAVSALLADGQNVMLSFYPSLLAQYGQADPWAGLVQPFGLTIDTSAVIYERIQSGNQQSRIETGAAIQEYDETHLIGRAVSGQRANFWLPLQIRLSDPTPPGVNVQVIAQIEASDNRWAEKHWNVDASTLKEPMAEQSLSQSAPVMAAVEKQTDSAANQKLIVVGSGGWLFRFIADRTISLGGGRAVLEYPGNYELLLASVAWLADMPELIAATPVSQGVSRLEKIAPAELAFWQYFIVLGVPVICLVLGLIVHMVRR
jgi:hypothetical protein